MEFVDGTDAARQLGDKYPAGMPVDDVIAIVTAVAAALDHAHKRGLLHRDVKPANIILAQHDVAGDEDRRILLADFGIARPLDEVSGLTTTNMTVGTVAYAAPEQLMGEDVDGRADQYGLAAAAYHLLSGEQLFPQSNPAVVISRHLNSDPPLLAARRPELAALDPVFSRALAKNPADRYVRCADFARALSGAMSMDARAASAPTASAPAAGRPVAARSGPDAGASRSSAVRWWLVVGSIAVVVVLVVGALIVWRPWRSPEHGAASASSTPSAAQTATAPPASSSVVAAPPLPPPPTGEQLPDRCSVLHAAHRGVSVRSGARPRQLRGQGHAHAVQRDAGSALEQPSAVLLDVLASGIPDLLDEDVCVSCVAGEFGDHAQIDESKADCADDVVLYDVVEFVTGGDGAGASACLLVLGDDVGERFCAVDAEAAVAARGVTIAVFGVDARERSLEPNALRGRAVLDQRDGRGHRRHQPRVGVGVGEVLDDVHEFLAVEFECVFEQFPFIAGEGATEVQC
jgi:hypothetical protein